MKPVINELFEGFKGYDLLFWGNLQKKWFSHSLEQFLKYDFNSVSADLPE